jgi:uracil-DNA glycosylase
MNMNKQQMLREMGLSPLWELRDRPHVAHHAPKLATPSDTFSAPAPEPISTSAMVSTPTSTSTSASTSTPAATPSSVSTALPLAQLSAQRATVRMAPKAVLPPNRITLLGWDELATSVADCRACGLCEQRRQAVLGVGDKAASWLFIGEGPGAEEDLQGEPFVGPAGQLLDAMLAAIGLSRQEDVYIANAVKCRPPSNRTPEASEIAACRPYLERQIALIQPKIIVLLGRAAVHAVLGKDDTLSSMRGKIFEYQTPERNIPVLVTYHPAYLLRTLPDKAKSWEDLCRARTLMRQAKQAATDKLVN